MSELRLPHDGWIVVADGEKALFLRNEGDEKYPNLEVFREIEHENPQNREWGTDRPGRLNDGGPAHRSAVEETDWHRLEKDRFAGELANLLYRFAHNNKFSKLILVAPPHTLGEIRDRLHNQVSSRVIGEVDKTLTNHPVHEIEKIVLT